jgi:hypothetical protein
MGHDAMNLFQKQDPLGIDVQVFGSDGKVARDRGGVVTDMGSKIERVKWREAETPEACKKGVSKTSGRKTRGAERQG